MQTNFSIQPPEPIDKITQTVHEKEDFQFKSKKEAREDKPVEPDKQQYLQNLLSEHNITLNFRQDEETKQLIVELIDSNTGDPVRQIPSEVSLKLSAAFAKIQGQFIDEQI